MILEVTTAPQIETTARLARTIWTHHYVPIIGPEQVEYMLDRIQSAGAIKEQIESGYGYYLLYDNDNAVGYIALLEDRLHHKLMISKIYVEATKQGKGYGNQLLEFTKKKALQKDIQTIWLTVNRHNSNSINWYQKRGFEIVDEKKFDIGNGFVMDDYVLEVATKDLLV